MKGIRSIAVGLALLVSTLALGSTAWAGPQWCEEDPVFAVNGAIVDVTTSFPASYVSSVSRVHFDMQVPSNALALVVSLPAAVPTTASISRTLPAYYGIGQLPVVVTVWLETNKKFDHYTRVTGLSKTLVWSFEGTSAKPTKVKFSLYGLGLL